jgi:hypothetical protein
MSPKTAQIMIRPAYADDYDALARLAVLDSAGAVPPRPLLIAEVDGALWAAVSLRDGSSIADPFYPSAGVVTLLRAHAGGGEPELGARREWRRRLNLGRPRLVHG